MAKKNMVRAGNTSNRPEQLLAKRIIHEHLRGLHTIETEYKVEDYSIDIAILQHDKKIAIELHGPIHDEIKRERHDRLKRLKLQELGWIVVEFKYYNMPYLFRRVDRILTESEMKLAYNEIRIKLRQYVGFKYWQNTLPI